jgi:hypothetical protein
MPQEGRDFWAVKAAGPDYTREKELPQVDLREVLLLRLAGRVASCRSVRKPSGIQRDTDPARKNGASVLEMLKGREFLPFVSLFTVEEGRLGRSSDLHVHSGTGQRGYSGSGTDRVLWTRFTSRRGRSKPKARATTWPTWKTKALTMPLSQSPTPLAPKRETISRKKIFPTNIGTKMPPKATSHQKGIERGCRSAEERSWKGPFSPPASP